MIYVLKQSLLPLCELLRSRQGQRKDDRFWLRDTGAWTEVVAVDRRKSMDCLLIGKKGVLSLLLKEERGP